MIASSSRTRLLGLFVLLLFFIAGGLTGTVVNRTLLTPAGTGEKNSAANDTDCDEDDDDHDHRSPLDHLTLTADQELVIDSVIERRNDRIEEFWETAGPRIGAIADSARDEIRELLTPEQRVVFDSIIAARKADRKSVV